MNRSIALLSLALALEIAAQQQHQTMTAATANDPKIVASINGEVITQDKLDHLYNGMNVQMRTQYEHNGGKPAFLENYLRKRLIIQEAIKAGFDKRPEVQAYLDTAKESALFDRYIRDVIGSNVVTDAEVKKYYDDNPAEFASPEKIKVRHIIIMANGAGPKLKSKQEAAALIQKIAVELRDKVAAIQSDDSSVVSRISLSYFADAAKQYSEDGSAQSGGDLGWAPRGSLDPLFEEAAYSLKPGTVSKVIETRFGYHLIFVEDKRPAGQDSFDEVRPQIREFLLSQRMSNVMEAVTKLTNELRGTSKVAVYPENIR